jgi:hypothetical protein
VKQYELAKLNASHIVANVREALGAETASLKEAVRARS